MKGHVDWKAGLNSILAKDEDLTLDTFQVIINILIQMAGFREG